MAKFSVIIILLSILLAACGPGKKLAKSNANTTQLNTVIASLSKPIEFDYFSARIKATATTPENKQTVTVNTRIKIDSAIWMSFSKFGIEGAKAMITPDSIFLIDRINKEYTIKHISFIEELMGHNVDFTTLQSLIVGKPIYFEGENVKIFETNDESIGFIDNLDSYNNRIWVSTNEMLLQKMVINQTGTDTSITAINGDYQIVEEQNFSFDRNIKLKAETLYELDATYSRVSFKGPLDMPFRVSEKYKVNR